MNICGCLVHVAQAGVADVRQALDATPGVEVHAESDDGRIVVVVEDTVARLASETIMDLHQIPGVISLTLNYHHFEDSKGAKPGHPALQTHTEKGQCHEHL